MNSLWHTLTQDVLAEELRSSSEIGLAEHEAQRRLAKYGPNELPRDPPISPLKLLLAQFSSLIVWVLIGAAVVSGLLQEKFQRRGGRCLRELVRAVLGKTPLGLMLSEPGLRTRPQFFR